MKKKLFLFKFFLTLLVSLLVSCSASTKGDILDGTEQCAPPCWLGVEPGITTKNEMVVLLDNYQGKNRGTFILLDNEVIRWRSNDGINSYLYTNEAGIVSKIDVDLRPSSINLDNVINRFGAPSNLLIEKNRDGHFFFSVYYPIQGLVFVVAGEDSFTNNQPKHFEIMPTQTVIKSIFIQPSDTTEIIKLLYGKNKIDEIILNLQDWVGYGDYSE